MKKLTTFLIAAPLLLTSGLSLAAPRLDLMPGAGTSFGLQMSMTAPDGPLVANTPGLELPTVSSSTLAAGAAYAHSAAYGGGTARFDWQRWASVQTTGASAQWQLGGHSAMRLAGISGITEVYENSSAFLTADFLIADDTQPDGAPVRLTLAAASLFSSLSTLPGLAAASSFELLVVQGLDVVAQVSSADANGQFNRQFLSQVGANLTLQISQLNTPYRLDAAFDAPVSGLRFQADDSFAGSLAVSAVPEPAAPGLLLAGLLVLGFYRSSRNNRIRRTA